MRFLKIMGIALCVYFVLGLNLLIWWVVSGIIMEGYSLIAFYFIGGMIFLDIILIKVIFWTSKFN